MLAPRWLIKCRESEKYVINSILAYSIVASFVYKAIQKINEIDVHVLVVRLVNCVVKEAILVFWRKYSVYIHNDHNCLSSFKLQF